METQRLSVARNTLLRVYSGVERRMLYLAAGNDLGCSLWLFWHKCDAFYLVDPEMGKGVNYDTLINELTQGTAPHMPGVRLAVDGYEEGFWENALPGRRYHVYDPRTPNIRKRLCFVCAGTTDWLRSTTSRYNVVLCKDYMGITEGPDSNFPYDEVWGRLNHHGIFGETIGADRSGEESDFAKYRYLGFRSFLKVIGDDDRPLGFGAGLVLFRKENDANTAAFSRGIHNLERVTRLAKGIFSPFLGECDFSPDAIKDKAGYAGLFDLMTNKGIGNWNALYEDGRFENWLVEFMAGQGVTIDLDLLFDMIGPLKIKAWGGW